MRPAIRAGERQRAKQDKIIAIAMEHFATYGYEGARAETIATAAGVSKGTVFGYFGSKAGLFLAAYQAATRTFSKYLDAPAEILGEGFFATISYWLAHTPHLIHEDWIPYRVVLIGSYCADLQLKREISKYMQREDPYGRFGYFTQSAQMREQRVSQFVELLRSAISAPGSTQGSTQ